MTIFSIRNEALEEGKEKGLKKGRKEGLKEGEEKKAIEIAGNLLKDGLSLKKISTLTGLSIAAIQRLQKGNKR